MSKPYMPFYWGDYLKDTAHLTARQHGVYLLLIGHYWETGKPIAMLEQCYVVARAFDGPTRADVDFVLSEFFSVDGAAYRHSRIDKEVAKYLEKHEKRVAAGARGAAIRHGNASSNASSNANGLLVAKGKQSESESESEVKTTPLVPAVPAETVPACDFDSIVELYHEALPSCPRVAALSEARRAKIRARWRERWELNGRQGKARAAADLLNWFAAFFGHVDGSDFLTGKSTPTPGRPPFVASLDWLMTQGNFLKVIEGSYHR